MRSSYNTFNANQRLNTNTEKERQKQNRKKERESERECRLKTNFYLLFQKCNESNASKNWGAASRTEVAKSNKSSLRQKAETHNRTKSNKEKETAQCEKEIVKIQIGNWRAKKEKYERQKLPPKAASESKSAGKASWGGVSRQQQQQQQFQEPFRLFTDFGSNEFNLLR